MSNDTNKKLIEAIKAYGYWEEAPEIEKVVIEWINRDGFGEICEEIENKLRHSGALDHIEE